MKNNFVNQMFRDGSFDPVSLGLGGLQSLIGIGQSLFSGRKKAERQLNKTINNAPKTTANSSILDYYNKALAKYNVNPYNSNLYNMQKQQANRSLTSGLSALSDRRSALAGIGGLVQNTNDALLRAGATAEQNQAQSLSQLGQATGMKANEEQRVFEQNEMLPFNLRTQLGAMKLQGANQRTNSGMQNLWGGLNLIGSGYTKNG